MPVQINEVIVRAVVDNCPPSSGSNDPECPPAANSGAQADTTETILEILKQNKER
jgi:Family of unknown function (DUF5908)